MSRPDRASLTTCRAQAAAAACAAWLACLALLWPLSTWAAPIAASAPTSSTPAIASALSGLGAAKLDDGQRALASAALASAAAWDDEASAMLAQAGHLREQAAAPLATAPAPTLSLDEQQRQLQQWVQRVPANATTDTLERLLTGERAEVEATRSALADATQEMTDLISRPSPAAAELAALRQVAEAPAPVAADDEPPALAEAHALRHKADQRRALAELALREAEQTTAAARQARLERQVAMLRQQLAAHQPRVTWLERRIATVAQARLTQQHESLAALVDSVPPGTARTQAKANAELADALLDHSERLTAERERLAAQERMRESVSAALRDTEARLRVGGNSDAIGQWLWQRRLAMPSLASLRLQRRDVQERLGRLRLDLFNTVNRRDSLDEAEGSPAAGLLAVLGERNTTPATPADPDTVRQRALQATEVNLQQQLEPLLRRRIEVLEASDAALQTLQEDGTALQQLMDRQLLWTPSHAAIGAAWLARWDGAWPQGWGAPAAGRLVWRDFGANPASWAVAVLGVVLAMALRRRGLQRLAAIARAVADPARDRFIRTVEALGWSVLTALPPAAAAWLFGQRLQQVAVGAHAGLEVLGQTLQGLTLLLLLLALVRALLRPDGLAAAHLAWSPQRLSVLHRAWLAALAVSLPASFVVLLALQSESAQAIDTWARLAVMVQGAGLALAGAWLARHLLPQPASLAPLTRRVGAAVLPLAFLATVVMAATGYVYSAIIVQTALIKSATVLLAVAVIDGLLKRWLLLGEQRLRLRQQALAAAEDAGVPDVEGGETASEASAQTLITISAQSRRLLRLLRVVLITAGVVWACMDVLPALLRFDDIALWSSEEQPVTVMDVLTTLALLGLTASLARNLPGLVEMGLTPYGRISAAGRYTLSTLARYAVVIVGALYAFSALGLRWNQLQWMAAALTVGLGFGLQEIFANFVSGLILLVERPFRVGDTITIGDLTGSVTRIHTRATTVLDYDNKEIVIPNKTFITGQVTNWTLSDNVTRLTLQVGVAYGSPAAKVRALLLDVARAHPLVLAEPPPNCWLMALGGSTLDFELRVYVGSLGDRLVTRHELLARITEAFAQAGIDIAFPQMDVHVRDLPERPARSEQPDPPEHPERPSGATQTARSPASPGPAEPA